MKTENKFKKIFVLAPLLSVVIFASTSFAEGEWFPRKAERSVLSTTLVNDAYTGFTLQSNDHLNGSIAVLVPFLGYKNEAQDQILIDSQVNFSTHFEGPTIYAETLDVRVSLEWMRTFFGHHVFSTGFTHTSGHDMDDTPDQKLIPLNMGSDNLFARWVNDGANPFRYGAYLDLFLGSDPVARTVTGGVFGEYYLWGTKENSPFIAQSVFLPESLNIGIGTNSVLGYSYKTIRLIAGYAQGPDPRLKQQLYFNLKAYYYYGGIRFEL